MKYTEFYDAFDFLEEHPIFKDKTKSAISGGIFPQCLDINVVKVNPQNETIEDDKQLNTAVRVWLECSIYDEDNQIVWDYDLDCGGPTFEEAIVNLAQLVLKDYGDYEPAELTEAERVLHDTFLQELMDRNKKE